MQNSEAQFFELHPHLVHAQPVRDRCVDFHCFARDPFAFLHVEMAERSHVVQTIGEFHHDDTDITRHG